MSCSNCGHQNATAAAFCNACGGSLTGAPPLVRQVGPVRTSGMAIAGFVCAFFCGLLGLILSIMARSEINDSNGELGGEGLATGGIVISVVNMLLGLMIQLG